MEVLMLKFLLSLGLALKLNFGQSPATVEKSPELSVLQLDKWQAPINGSLYNESEKKA